MFECMAVHLSHQKIGYMNPKNTENTKHIIIPAVNSRFTRGKGYLEPFLARQRARTANRLIPAELRSERILDVGCGTFPYFLLRTEFEKKSCH